MPETIYQFKLKSSLLKTFLDISIAVIILESCFYMIVVSVMKKFKSKKTKSNVSHYTLFIYQQPFFISNTRLKLSGLLRDRYQTLLLILSQFKWIN